MTALFFAFFFIKARPPVARSTSSMIRRLLLAHPQRPHQSAAAVASTRRVTRCHARTDTANNSMSNKIQLYSLATP